MPCSICGSITHHANDCTSVELRQSVDRIKALWLGENMPEGWTEELVKNWCATSRIGLPYWRRIWSWLDSDFPEQEEIVLRIPIPDRPAYWCILFFIKPRPTSVGEFKQRVQDYVRPAQYPHVVPPRPFEDVVAPPRPPGIPLQINISDIYQYLTDNISHLMYRRDNQILPQVLPDRRAIVRKHTDTFNTYLSNSIRNHRRRILQRLQEFQTEVLNQNNNTKNIRLVRDAPDSADYFVDPTCPICMEDISPQTVLAFGCKHTLCGSCTAESLKKPNICCPTCRTPVTEIRFKHNTTPDTFHNISSHLSFS